MGILFRILLQKSYFKVILTDKNIGITFYLIMAVFENYYIVSGVRMKNMNIVVELKEETFYWDFY